MPVIILRNQRKAFFNGAEQTGLWIGGAKVWTRPQPWTPAAEIPSGKYAWWSTAKRPFRVEAGRSYLDDQALGASGIVLAAKDAAAASQPTRITDTDGLPSIRMNATDASQRLGYPTTLGLDTETAAMLVKPRGGPKNTASVFSFGNSSGTFLDCASGGGGQYQSGQFRAYLQTSTGDIGGGNMNPIENFTDKWMLWIAEMEHTAGAMRVYINGSLRFTVAFPASGVSVNGFAIAAERNNIASAPMDFAAGCVLHGLGHRQNIIDHFKREWGSRVVG